MDLLEILVESCIPKNNIGKKNLIDFLIVILYIIQYSLPDGN